MEASHQHHFARFKRSLVNIGTAYCRTVISEYSDIPSNDFNERVGNWTPGLNIISKSTLTTSNEGLTNEFKL